MVYEWATIDTERCWDEVIRQLNCNKKSKKPKLRRREKGDKTICPSCAYTRVVGPRLQKNRLSNVPSILDKVESLLLGEDLEAHHISSMKAE